MANRVYVGRLPYRATKRDLKKFFNGFPVTEIFMKNGFAFVDFEEIQDAEDAADEMNGKEMMGGRLIVEIAKGTPRGRDFMFWNGPPKLNNDMRHSRSSYSSSRGYRVIVENLSSKVDKIDLKDLFGKCGEIIYVDAHRRRKNEGYAEFSHRDDAEFAVDKFDGFELEGKKLKVYEEKRRSRSRSFGDKRKSIDKDVGQSSTTEERSRSRSPYPDRKSEQSNVDV